MHDLRSDTLTKPTSAMRKAIHDAEVGDDVFGEDPTVNRLEKKVAERFGKEAALFVPSGTMANQIGIHLHTKPRDEVICHETAHVFLYESAAAAMISSVQFRPLAMRDGFLDPASVLKAIRPIDHHAPRTGLFTIENTTNRGGGRCYPLQVLNEIRDLSVKKSIPIHLDGARIWNAAIAQGKSLDFYTSFCDSMSVCFSKGLGAPVGSAILGTKAMIEFAKHVRKALGGGMRQVGILASACEYAMDHQVERLKDDHALAKAIAELVSKCSAFEIDPSKIETNIAYIKVKTPLSAEIAVAVFKKHGILCLAMDGETIRMVTSLEISERLLPDLTRALGEF